MKHTFVKFVHRSAWRGGRIPFLSVHCLLGCVLLAAIPVQAQLIVSESFNYTSGSALTGQNGGSGWLGAWTAAASAGGFNVGTGLTYPGLTNSGNAIQDTITGTEYGNTRQWFDPNTPFAHGTHIWFSFLVKYNVNHNSDITVAPFGKPGSNQDSYGVTINCRPAANLTQNGSPRAYIRANGSTLGMGGSSSGAGLTAATNYGMPILIVGRFVLSTNNNGDTLDVWVNQTSAPTNNSLLRLTGFTAFRSSGNSEGKLHVYSGYSAQGTVDEIAIGNSYADVTRHLATNPMPAITLTAPMNDSLYAAPATINLTTSVATNGHTVAKVQFFRNYTNLIGENAVAPFSYAWVNAPAGTCNLSARLVYDGGFTLDTVANYVYVFTNTPAVITVNVQSNRHAISPHIYGVNNIRNANHLAELNYALNRRGGEVESRYNWQLDAHNICKDWYFISMGPSTHQPSGDANSYIQPTFATGADIMVTIPTIGWMPKLGPNRSSLWSYSIAKYGPQTEHEPYGAADAGNGISVTNNTRITWNDKNDANFLTNSAFQGEWVKYLTNRWGVATNGGVRFYTIDNEPGLWGYTHRDVRPNGVTTNEIRDYSLEYGAMIKKIDPHAQICGPNDWGWMAWWGYSPWFLSEMRKYEQTNGVRVLDYLTLNYYAGTRGAEGSVEQILSRNRSTRTLWDTNYADEGINWASAKVGLVRTMKRWVAQNYPGTKIGITEYYYGSDTAGAIAQADAIGIFGREGMDLATRWGSEDINPATLVFKGMKMYRNYDNQKSTFGDISVSAALPNNPDETSAFAAQRTRDYAVTVMFINKQLVGNEQVTIVLSNFVHAGSAQVWQLTETNVVTRLPDVAISGRSFTTTVPKQSVTLFVVDSGIPIIAGPATNPNPADNATGISVTPTLRWTPGSNAFNHYVYLGTSSNAVANATTNSPEFKGVTSGSDYSAGALSALTSYFWRVDSKANSTPTTGAVWKFTTATPPPFQPVQVNFQTSDATPVPGYLVDSGATYASRNGQTYGWNADHSDVSRDRGINADQLLDTLVHFHADGFWEIALPNGAYQVKVSIGDAGHPSTHTINVEGINYWNVLNLSANVFANATKTVTVSDGRLTVNQGTAADKATRINYIEISAAPPGIASNPSPANAATQIVINPTLRWNAGSNAVSHLVYFGINSNAVAAATLTSPEFMGNVTSTNFAPGTLADVTTYYWRIDELGGATNSTGPVWRFATVTPTVGRATDPSPAHGAANVATNTVLTWVAGANALSHEIYFGANSNSIATATTNSPEFKGTQTATNFTPATLASSGRYFWRVDEVGASSSTNGVIWTFATLVNPNGKPQIVGAYNGNFSVSFPSQIGQTYRVERTDSISPATWQVASNSVPGTGGLLEIPESSDPDAPQGFYRVLILSP